MAFELELFAYGNVRGVIRGSKMISWNIPVALVVKLIGLTEMKGFLT